MKNENTNLNKDEYLVVNYDKIMDYIWFNQFKLNENYFYILYIYLIIIIFHIKLKLNKYNYLLNNENMQMLLY